MASNAATTSFPADAASAGGKKPLDWLFLIAGLIGLAIAGVGIIIGVSTGDPRPVKSWLVGLSFWLSMGIGMLFLVMMFYIFDAGWAVVVRRQLEHGLAAFKWLALLFVPLLVVALLVPNYAVTWKWMNPSLLYPGGPEIASDPLFTHKAPYLNTGFFVFRILVYFVIFAGLAHVLRKRSFAMDEEPHWRHFKAAGRWSCAGVILTALATTFFAVDAFMSLSYHWFSTMYGVWFFALSMRLGLAGAVILCYVLATRGCLQGVYRPAHSYYLGCLCLAFTIFWAYISFSQYFLIWNANIPEETFWYNIRELSETGAKNQWWWLSLGALIGGMFIVPFFYLLWYKNKFGKRLLAAAIWICVFGVFDLMFNILPAKKPLPEDADMSKYPLGYKVSSFLTPELVFDFAAIIGVGGVCVWAVLRSMKTVRPLPIHDPRIEESLNASE